ncbi:MAG: Gfo/Idh/MocA family oxidoreductase [Anaerolineaceae bacterium]|jgi:predicted dehydrogenase|nr:Gfo/Idh/MocA family oxidoreductase [Anaerolineaceae bacterium]MDI9531646.1 Gfo/Idh/MocA family oxidoreductase [Chloroflexota bacterium]HOF27908.1 Gfo/Idh/MocA family oxidoreductase [Anaerolineaceae bacterium]
MKFLIAGLGSIGRRHLRNLRTLGQQDILLYRTHQATLPDAELDGFPAFSELSLALAQKPDGVIVANPTALHLEVAIASAKAGAALLIEKPVSSGLAGLDELKSALNTSGKPALVGFHFRFHPVLNQIKTLLESGQLGKPLSARAHWGEYLPDWHPWEDYRRSYAARAELGGGVVNTLSHPLDYLRWLLGEVESVNAWTGRLSSLELDVEDNAEILLRFANGTEASLHLDYYQRPPSHTLEITCEEGRVCWDNASGEARVYRASAESPVLLVPPEGFDRNQMFLDEMAAFLRLCGGENLPHCTLADGIRVQEIVQAVKQSASQEGCMVRLG